MILALLGGEWFLYLVLITLHFIPTFIAYGKNNFWQVFAVNFLLGWSFLGWAIALVMSLKKNK